jgi:hypothetical protein
MQLEGSKKEIFRLLFKRHRKAIGRNDGFIELLFLFKGFLQFLRIKNPRILRGFFHTSPTAWSLLYRKGAIAEIVIRAVAGTRYFYRVVASPCLIRWYRPVIGTIAAAPNRCI